MTYYLQEGQNYAKNAAGKFCVKIIEPSPSAVKREH